MNFRQAVKFSPLISNKFWDRICLINDKHVTASQQYLMLMQDLENQGVKFTEIMEFLLNEAKRAGLYQKVAGEYPKLKQVKDTPWGRALYNTGEWIKNNYDGSYDKRLTSQDRANKRAARKAEKAQRKQSTIVRNENGEVRTDVVTSTTDMDAPVEETLTPQQIEAILFNNLGLLGEYAEDKGALKEFNALMSAIGKPEARIVVEKAA